MIVSKPVSPDRNQPVSPREFSPIDVKFSFFFLAIVGIELQISIVPFDCSLLRETSSYRVQHTTEGRARSPEK